MSQFFLLIFDVCLTVSSNKSTKKEVCDCSINAEAAIFDLASNCNVRLSSTVQEIQLAVINFCILHKVTLYCIVLIIFYHCLFVAFFYNSIGIFVRFWQKFLTKLFCLSCDNVLFEEEFRVVYLDFHDYLFLFPDLLLRQSGLCRNSFGNCFIPL